MKDNTVLGVVPNVGSRGGKTENMVQGLEAQKGVATAHDFGRVPRLSEALFFQERAGFSSYVALPSNVKALESAMLFSSGFLTYVALVGASGWGKSHILNASAIMIRNETGATVHVHQATEWLGNCVRGDSSSPLILDDVQAVLGSPRLRQQLRLVLERRVRGGKPTMLSFTLDRSAKQLRSTLPYAREWTVGQIAAPDERERELFVRNLAKSSQMVLSDTLVRLIARKVQGNGRSIAGALHRLKLNQSHWVETGAVLKAIGILQPCVVGLSCFDLRDCAHESVLRAWSPESGKPYGLTATDMSVYMMLKCLQLSEREVSSYFRIDERDAYATAVRVEALCSGGHLGEVPDRCIESLLATLEGV